MRLSSDEDLTTAAQSQQRQRRFAWTTTTSWTFHLLALIVYTILFLQYQPPLALCNSHNPLQPREIPSAKDVASYETVEFAPFSFGYNHKQNAYTGSPTPESDAAWHRLWEVGVYSMTDEEYELWGGATVQVRDKPDQHIVVIEMFHQLHCVVCTTIQT